MRTDKLHAITLRQDGKSYSQISEILGVSRSTLSNWFKDIEWSKDLHSVNFRRNFSVEKLARMHEARLKKLENHYIKAKNEASEEYEKFNKDPLFMAGLMIYLLEGDKIHKNGLIRISNSNHSPIGIFKKFLEKYCNPHHEKAKIWLLLYPNLAIEECENWWSEMVEMPKERFTKSIVLSKVSSSKKLQYGLATLIISNKFLKTKILKWTELASKELTNAGIV